MLFLQTIYIIIERVFINKQGGLKMKQSAFVFGLFAALFGGILLGFMFSPVKNGIDFLMTRENSKTFTNPCKVTIKKI